MVEALKDRKLDESTVIILSAKHGQSPESPSALTRIDDGPILTGLNTAWAATHPGVTLVAFAVDDDGTLIWLNDRSAQDRDVPIVVSGDPIGHTCSQNPSPVETIQLAPTILQLLGLDPNSLQAVQIEHTQALPSG